MALATNAWAPSEVTAMFEGGPRTVFGMPVTCLTFGGNEAKLRIEMLSGAGFRSTTGTPDVNSILLSFPEIMSGGASAMAKRVGAMVRTVRKWRIGLYSMVIRVGFLKEN